MSVEIRAHTNSSKTMKNYANMNNNGRECATNVIVTERMKEDLNSSKQ